MSSDQKQQASSKSVIIMQPGPLHLFWTSGVFYWWLLQDRFNFVLIVSEDYRNNPQFVKVASHPSIRHVEYLSTKGRFVKHFRLSGKFRELLYSYQPAYLLLHNRFYFENMYLVHWARKIYPETPRYYYQNGRMPLMWQNDFAARRAGQTESFVKRKPLFAGNLWLAGKIMDLQNNLSYMLDYKILPLLVIREKFNPLVNVLNGSVYSGGRGNISSKDNDFQLAYLDIEIEAYRAHGISNILQINHPLSVCGAQVFTFLYGEMAAVDKILLLPSYGFTSMMIEAGWKDIDLVQHIAGKWCDAIAKLLLQFPGYELEMKLHPASLGDPIWHEIVKSIQLRYPTLQLIKSSESAEYHIVKSRVIVGDVSTVLWWAGMLGGKVCISLDIFGYPGGDELKRYPEIISYISSCEEILRVDAPIKSTNMIVGSQFQFPFV
jgi:hypothetical protein